MTEASAGPADILERICGENLAVYRESQARLQEDVSQESQVAHDYRGRLVYELLQNADDAFVGVAATEDRALFRLTERELWVANTGRPFTEADVRGLCGLGASSKANADGPKRASIGHKGLGFKSVLEITEAPEAYADTICFRLGAQLAQESVQDLWSALDRGHVRGVPVMRFPASLSSRHPDWTQLQADGYHGAFRFPFRNDITSEQRSALARQLLMLPMTSVLFLKHLEEVVIEVDTPEATGQRQWLLERHRVSAAGSHRCSGLNESGLFRVDLINHDGVGERYWVAHDSDVVIGSHREGLTGPAWAGVDTSEVSVAVRADVDPRLDTSDRQFHVFLPTQEPAGCSLLINGAFTTDLSRQHVQVADTAADYNSHLVRSAAHTFATTLLPHLVREGGTAYALRVLEQDPLSTGPAAALIQAALAGALADAPLLPSGDRLLSLGQAVLPSPILGRSGHAFASLLASAVTVAGRSFPDPEYCEGDLAAVCAAYGATALDPVESLSVLAEHVDPNKAVLQTEPNGRYQIDPVLEVCTELWESADSSDRQRLEAAARLQPIFPTGVGAGSSTVTRIRLADETAFYPPRASADEIPLQRLRFLAHAVCWGTLGRTEQRSVLEQRMKAWAALFDIKEFRFEEVMRAAVLPGLTRTGGTDTELRDANRTIEALASICRLAGTTTKPDHPLPLGRLGSDRAFFNLSRLEVPCRTPSGQQQVWAPAHQVYFGRDWAGTDSVEEITEAMTAAGHGLALHFLAPPAHFEPYSRFLGIDDESESDAVAPAVDDGEVGIEDDTDEVLETSAADRWRNFFAWLGVSRALRLVHFHDVEDAGTGWTNTKGLTLPGGWAFTGLGEVWTKFRAGVEGSLSGDPRWDSTDHYVYQAHNLDKLDEIAAVARHSDNDVAERLIAHLARNWPLYAGRTQAQVALVGAGKMPSSRTAPPRATTDELVSAGPDLWLYRLRQHAICPTSHGPRRPQQTWRRSDELLRRLGRSGREADSYLPVLKSLADVPGSSLRACLDELRVRGELTPGAFTVADAHELCSRIASMYGGGVTDQLLRTELRPIYRQLFELLVGSTMTEPAPLADALLAARTAEGIRFLPASEVVYASVSGSRERSGVQGRVPLFVLEAEPGALAPLRNLFGTLLLENALEWSIAPGEAALAEADLGAFHQGLHELVPPLLARLSADRPERAATDRRMLLEFVEKVQPVDALVLRCSFQGSDLGELPPRSYFVQRSERHAFTGFVTWCGPAWPPISEDAQTLAMALAESLEVNTVETFLSFINANPAQRRELLDLAGAAERLEEVIHELAGSAAEESDAEMGSTPEAPALTDGEATEAQPAHAARAPLGAGARAAARVPLHQFEHLIIDGEVIRLEGLGAAPSSSPPSGGGGPADGAARDGAPGPRAAAGTDLEELDRLGMLITFAFERRRSPGRPAVVLPGEADPADAATLIVDVSSPKMIDAASGQSPVVKALFDQLADAGISPLYPGFDVLTITDGKIDRMIELKSSGFDAQVQAMSWNEWKTAQGSLREHFWLYLVGNLRADLQGALPFLRAVQDPFGTLASARHEDTIRKRTVQLRVREFSAADQLTLGLRVED